MTAVHRLLDHVGRWLADRDRRRVARSWVDPGTALYMPPSWCDSYIERARRGER